MKESQMEVDKSKLAEQLFNNLSETSEISHEMEDDNLSAIFSTIYVILFNNQYELMNEIFTYFQEEIFPKVEQPKEATCQTVQ